MIGDIGGHCGRDSWFFRQTRPLVINPVYIERSEVEETGEHDLDGLFIRLGTAIDSIKAKRVVLDTIELQRRHPPLK